NNTQQHGNHTQDQGGSARYTHDFLVRGFALLDQRGVQVVRHGGCTGERQTSHHSQNRGKRHCRHKAQEHVATNSISQVHSGHNRTANQIDANVQEARIVGLQHDSAETNNEGQDVEVTNPGGCPEHGFTCFFCIRHGKETHQNVWQTSSTKHQSHTEGNRAD